MITVDASGSLTEERAGEYVSRLIEFVGRFERKKGLWDVGDGIIVDEFILHECVKKTHDDLYRYTKRYNFSQNINTPNHFKQAAHLSFWIRRLRPLRIDVPEGNATVSRDYIKRTSLKVNEEFALTVGALISIEGEDQSGRTPLRTQLKGGFLEDMVIMCKFKSISPHALMMIFRAYFGSDNVDS